MQAMAVFDRVAATAEQPAKVLNVLRVRCRLHAINSLRMQTTHFSCKGETR